MKINDAIYGEEEINEEILIELINSKPLQRLKRLNQYGLPDKYYHKKNFSRYEHSIGVLILLRKLNAILEEQVSGLLHDASHPAFSHVIDSVIGDPTREDYQDKIHKEVLELTDIPAILNKYNLLDIRIFHPENFSLLEREAPSLCADRVDYALREINQSSDASHLFFDLINKNGQLCFKSREIGEEFAEGYIHLQKEHWAGDESKMRYYIFSTILTSALRKQIISMNDLRTTDQEVIDLLIQSKDREILERLNLLEKGFGLFDSEEGIDPKKKFRYIDPEISVNGSYKKLSEISVKYANLLHREKEESKLIKKLKIISK